MTAVLSSLLVGGAAASLLCLVVSHGILKPLLHSRGVSSWTLRDTVGSTVLLMAGAACFGASTTLLVLMLGGLQAGRTRGATMIVLAAIGLSMIRFGLLSLRKLS
jgi:hypothetical protein